MATLIFLQKNSIFMRQELCVTAFSSYQQALFQRSLASSSLALCPLVGRPRPAVVASRTVRSGVFHHWIHHLWPQGAVPPGFNPLRRGWVYRPAPEAPRKGECRRGPRHFWNCLPRWASALR